MPKQQCKLPLVATGLSVVNALLRRFKWRFLNDFFPCAASYVVPRFLGWNRVRDTVVSLTRNHGWCRLLHLPIQCLPNPGARVPVNIIGMTKTGFPAPLRNIQWPAETFPILLPCIQWRLDPLHCQVSFEIFLILVVVGSTLMIKNPKKRDFFFIFLISRYLPRLSDQNIAGDLFLMVKFFIV